MALFLFSQEVTWDLTYLLIEKKHPDNYVIVTSDRSEVSNVLSNNFIRMSSIGVVETYLYENVTETYCLGAIFTCSIYGVAVKCYFGGVLTSSNENIEIMSYLGVVLTPPLQNCMMTPQKDVKC